MIETVRVCDKTSLNLFYTGFSGFWSRGGEGRSRGSESVRGPELNGSIMKLGGYVEIVRLSNLRFFDRV